MDSPTVYILLHDIEDEQAGFRANVVWKGKKNEMVQLAVVSKMVEDFTSYIGDDEEWFDVENCLVRNDGPVLFGVSTEQSQESFCQEVVERYSGKEDEFIKAINDTAEYYYGDLVAIEVTEESIAYLMSIATGRYVPGM